MVSVIIVNYNTFQLTVSCIQSVIEYTKECSYEIILVDNASSECNPDLFTQQFPGIILIKSTDNTGFARGNNLGIDVAKGDYLLLLNSDTELITDAISISLKAMHKDDKTGVVTCKLIYPNGEAQSVVRRFPSLKFEFAELLRLKHFYSAEKIKNIYHEDYWDYSLATETDWVWGAFFLIPKTVLNQFPNQRLHSDYFMYYEDVLWCFYIKNRLNLKIKYVPEAVVIHHLSASSKSADNTNKNMNKILPNESHFLRNNKGIGYTFIYYFIKGIHQVSLRKQKNRSIGFFYIKHAFKNVFGKIQDLPPAFSTAKKNL